MRCQMLSSFRLQVLFGFVSNEPFVAVLVQTPDFRMPELVQLKLCLSKHVFNLRLLVKKLLDCRILFANECHASLGALLPQPLPRLVDVVFIDVVFLLLRLD